MLISIKRFGLALSINLIVMFSTIAQNGPAWKGRIAISHDGNIHDPDDIGSSAFAFATVWSFGYSDKFVHQHHSNHLGKNGDGEEKMIESSEGGAKRFGVPLKNVFNAFRKTQETVEHFKIEGNKSTEFDRLTTICAGPMEMCWKCLDTVDLEKRKYLTFISHSGWNDDHSDTPELIHTWDDLKKITGGAEMIHISDQSSTLGKSRGNVLKFATMKTWGEEKWNWLDDRHLEGVAGDVSDLVMVWYAFTGNQSLTAEMLLQKFQNPGRPTSIAIHTNVIQSNRRLIQSANEYNIQGKVIKLGKSTIVKIKP